MGEWLAQTPAVVASIAVVFGPGLLVLAAVGVRGLGLWALAPALSTTVLTASALITGLIGIPWAPLPALLSTLILAAAAFALRRAFGLDVTPGRRPDRMRPVLVAGIVLGIVYTVLRLALYVGEPAAVSQTNDAAFHLSALRFALETGAASPLEISRVIGATTFYPSGWHVLAVLVPALTGATVEVAANTVSLVIGALAWPLGVAYLARSAAGSTAGAIAAASAGALPAFPLLLMQWGILYPQLLAVAVLPAALGAVIQAKTLRGEDSPGWRGALRVVFLVAAAAAAIAVAQPSVLLAWAAAALVFGASSLILRRAAFGRRARALSWGALLAGTVITAAAWWYFSRSVSVTWPPFAGKAEALLHVLVNAYLGYPPSILVSALALVGLIVAAIMPRLRWLAVVWLGFAGLYVTAAAVGSPLARSVLVGAWYEDPYRLAALTPVATLPLAGVGGAWLITIGIRAVQRMRKGHHAAEAEVDGTGGRDDLGPRVAGVSLGLLGVAAAVALVLTPQIDRRDVFVDRVDPNLYAVTGDSFLTADELTLLERLDELVPEDAVIIANPSTGASFGYALSGRDVVPRTWAPPSEPAYSTLWTNLRDVAADPAVCSALDAFDARYMLDFGPGEAYPGRWIMPGFTDIEGQPGFELVDREGDASLWRVTACP